MNRSVSNKQTICINYHNTTQRNCNEKLLGIAQQSYMWYETFHEKMDLDALPLVYSYMTRSGRIDRATLSQKAPRFLSNYEAYLAAKQQSPITNE